MKKERLIIVFLFFCFGCFDNVNSIQDKKIGLTDSYLQLLPMEIYFSGLGLNDKISSKVIINSDSIYVESSSDKFIRHSFADSKFIEILTNFDSTDFIDAKHYYHPFVTDGGTSLIKNEYGNRKFTNVFRFPNLENVKPDTIGMLKFKSLIDYSNILISELNGHVDPVN